MNDLESDIVSDGIIDPERWRDKDNPKILFILREPSQAPDNPEKSLADFFLKHGPTHSFVFLNEIVWGIKQMQRDGKQPDYEEARVADPNRELFLSSALINIRKLPGGAACDLRRLESYAETHATDLIRQIKAIDPRVIICCGTLDLLKRKVLKDLRPISVEADCWVHSDSRFQIPFLKTCHPQASRWLRGTLKRTGNRAKFDDLIADYSQSIRR